MNKISIGLTKQNNKGCEMTIVEYNGYDDIVVQFNDKYKCKVHSLKNVPL